MASTKAIVNKEDVKRYLNLTDSSKDTFIQDLIDLASGEIEQYCNRTKFALQDITGELVDGTGESILYTKYSPIYAIGSSSATQASTDVQYRATPDGSWTDLESDTDFFWVEQYGNYIEFHEAIVPSGKRNVKVNYRAGYSPVPEDVQRVCIEMVAMMWSESNNGERVLGKSSTSMNTGGGSISSSYVNMSDRWRVVLAKYRTINV